MDALSQMMRNLGPTRLAVMGAMLFGLIGFFIFITARLSAPSLELLYRELDAADASRIVQQLETANIPFEIKQNGSAIHVPSDQVARLRLKMANQGLPTGGSVGYEIFDNAESLGTTNFVQNVNLVRALEGELARTIRSLANVKTARVHLVLPKRELFSREKPQPSTSITLKMAGAQRLDKEQISAIQHLVAAAVPGLNPRRISIIDNRGSLLAAGFEDSDNDQVQARKGDDRRRQFEAKMGLMLENLLTKNVGMGKVRAEVSAEMDFDRITTNEELFDPDGQVVRSTHSVEEGTTSSEAGPEPVSVGQNLPDPNATTAQGPSASNSQSRTDETVNYEITKKIVSHVRDIGVVRRLSVAVLVDGIRTLNADTGNLDYTKRSEGDMKLLTQLVHTAIGYDPNRGDTVDVINLEFVDQDPEAEPKLELFFGMDKNDMLRLAEILVLSIVAILVILLVVRPVITRAFESLPQAADALSHAAMLSGESGAPALTGPGGVPVPTEDDDEFEELIDIDRVEGRVKASAVKKIEEIVDKHPAEALSIVRSWMYQE